MHGILLIWSIRMEITKIGNEGLPFIFLTKIGISLIPNNNTTMIKIENIGIPKKSSPIMIIPKREGIPNKLIITLEEFLSDIVQL